MRAVIQAACTRNRETERSNLSHKGGGGRGEERVTGTYIETEPEIGTEIRT